MIILADFARIRIRAIVDILTFTRSFTTSSTTEGFNRLCVATSEAEADRTLVDRFGWQTCTMTHAKMSDLIR